MAICPPLKRPTRQILFPGDADFTTTGFVRFRKATIKLDTNLRCHQFSDWIDERKHLFRQFAPALSGCSLTFRITDSVDDILDGKNNSREKKPCELRKKLLFISQIIAELFAVCGRFKFSSEITNHYWGEQRLQGEQLDISLLLSPEPLQRCGRIEIEHRNIRRVHSGFVQDFLLAQALFMPRFL